MLESQRLHLSYSIKVPTKINIAKSSVLAFFLAKFDFRLACDVGLHQRSGSLHLHHVAETAAAEPATSACVSDFRSRARVFCLPDTNVIKSRKKHTHAPQNELQ